MELSQEPAADPALLERIRRGVGPRDWSTLTLAQLAELGGMSRMTLHRRGLTKPLVLELLAQLLQREQDTALLGSLTGPGTARERLRGALEALCDVDERYLGVLDALARQLDDVVHERGQPGAPVLARASFTRALRRLLQDGALDGSIDVEDPELTATVLLNAVGHTYRHLRTGHRWPADDARRRVVALVVDGLGPSSRVTPVEAP